MDAMEAMNGLYDGEFVGFKIASSDEIDTALREAVVAIDANVLLDVAIQLVDSRQAGGGGPG